MHKKIFLTLIATAFIISTLGCGHLKKPFKRNPGKKKGHNKYHVQVPFQQ